MPSLDALPPIAAVVDGKVPLLVDSGVWRGVDALKAVALGAQGVAIGRAALFGAAAGGEAGVRPALEILTDELRLPYETHWRAAIGRVDDDIIAPSTHPIRRITS